MIVGRNLLLFVVTSPAAYNPFTVVSLSLVDDEASFRILLGRHAVDDPSKWCRTNGDEYPSRGGFPPLFNFTPVLPSCHLRQIRQSYSYGTWCFLGLLPFDPEISPQRGCGQTDEDMDVFTDFGEVERFGDGCISCSDDGNRSISVEVSITGRTVWYSLSIELPFRQERQVFGTHFPWRGWLVSRYRYIIFVFISKLSSPTFDTTSTRSWMMVEPAVSACFRKFFHDLSPGSWKCSG